MQVTAVRGRKAGHRWGALAPCCCASAASQVDSFLKQASKSEKKIRMGQRQLFCDMHLLCGCCCRRYCCSCWCCCFLPLNSAGTDIIVFSDRSSSVKCGKRVRPAGSVLNKLWDRFKYTSEMRPVGVEGDDGSSCSCCCCCCGGDKGSS